MPTQIDIEKLMALAEEWDKRGVTKDVDEYGRCKIHHGGDGNLEVAWGEDCPRCVRDEMDKRTAELRYMISGEADRDIPAATFLVTRLPKSRFTRTDLLDHFTFLDKSSQAKEIYEFIVDEYSYAAHNSRLDMNEMAAQIADKWAKHSAHPIVPDPYYVALNIADEIRAIVNPLGVEQE